MSKLIPITTPLRKFNGHEGSIHAVAVLPDRRRMVTRSDDKTLRLWDLKTGELLKKMKGHSGCVWALAVSRDGQFITSGDKNGEIIAWHGETGESLTQSIKAHSKWISSLDFSPDGTVLATSSGDGTTKLWNAKTWEQQGNSIECGSEVCCVQHSPSRELLAIATRNNIQVYNSHTGERVANFKGHTSFNMRLTWTPDGTRLLTGGSKDDPSIREWDTSNWQQVGVPWTGHTSYILGIAVNPAGTLVASASDDKHVRLWRLSDRRTVAIFQHSSPTACVTFSVDGRHILSGGNGNQVSEWAVPNNINSKILAITAAHDACINGDISGAKELLTQAIEADANNHTSYAHRSFVMSREHDWVHALEDAIKSIDIQPSLEGYISKGIALCGNGHVRDARAAFDVASMYTNQDSQTIHFLLLVKAIALFNADQHDEALLLLRELAAGCPNADTMGCHVVQAYLRVQLGIKADAHHEEAADHFTAAVSPCAFSSKCPIHETYEDLVVLFGFDLKSLWLTAHQKWCQAFLSAGKHEDALKSHTTMMDTIDETTKASCLNWSTDFQRQCSALAVVDDRILGAEIPGQDQSGYDAEPDFFRGMPEHSQISQPRPQQRPGRFKKLRLAVTRTLRPASVPPPPTTVPSTTTPATFKAQLRHLFTRRPDRARPPVVEVPFAQGQLRNATAGAPTDDEDLVPDEYFDTDPFSQQQTTDVGEHGGGKSCFCC